jgi:glycosyltransferase involved in cell wall biosynthesis
MILGIDACRNRSGGAIAHLKGILSAANPQDHGIRQVHLWSHQNLLAQVPERPWLVKQPTKELDGPFAGQLWWQATRLSHAARQAGCDLIFTTDASTLCRFAPMVTLSQDMLSYEPGIMQTFGWSVARARLLAILWLQNAALRRSHGAIFLSRYAGELIQQSCGPLANVAYVPHGVGDEFRTTGSMAPWPQHAAEPIRCVYVSNAALYKHQWQVVRAVAALRVRGCNLVLDLVGGGSGPAQRLLDSAIAECDPGGTFVRQRGKITHGVLPEVLRDSHLFIFASSCENLPVTLLEGMATGLPIACAARGPMPEVLQDGGVYFDPSDVASISGAIASLLANAEQRARLSAKARRLAANYTWTRCANATWEFISTTYRNTIRYDEAL